MAEPEAINTMVQNSYVKLGDGSYAQKTASAGSVGIDPQTSGPNAESGFGINSVVAPAAGAVIATHTPPVGAAGELHEIDVTVWYSAGVPADATENSNMAFKFGGGIISALPVVPALNTPVKTKFYFKAAAATPFAVVAVGAGAAAVKYNAFITATKVVS